MATFRLKNRISMRLRAGVLLTLVYGVATAQSLARPGWVGAGIAPETWWRRAVFYRIDDATLPTPEQLPSLQTFGFDGILLTPAAMVPPPPAGDPSVAAPMALDELFSQCSRLHMHVLVPLDVSGKNGTPDATLALAKSWLYRGASGFVLTGLVATTEGAAAPIDLSGSRHHRQTSGAAIHLAKSTEPQVLVSLHALMAKFSGDKILISATPTNFPDVALQLVTLAPATAPSENVSGRTLLSLNAPSTLTPMDAARLLLTPAPAVLDSEAVPASLLAKVFPLPSAPAEVEAAPPPPPPPPPSNVYGAYVPFVSKDTPEARKKKADEESAAKEAAMIAAETFPVQSDYEPISQTPVGLAAYYHRLVQLRHSAETLADGTVHSVAVLSPGIAWVVTRAGKPNIVVVLNPTTTPQQFDMTVALKGIATSRLAFRTLSHTAASSGVVHLDRVEVGPNGVYAGELASGFVYR